MSIKPEHYVNLKGKQHPVWAGVILAALEDGLQSLTTDLIQIPGEENGHVAIVRARAEFKDGRVFVDYGDASPKNCAPMIANASIRMASTRAKGRVLRDAIGLGETLGEELGDNTEGEEERPAYRAARANGPAVVAAESLACSFEGCGKPLTRGQYDVSVAKFKKGLCPLHQKEQG